MSEYPHTTADLAAELGVTTNTVRKRAKSLGIGIDLQGRAGFRYSEADRRQLLESLRPAAPTVKRRPRSKRRAA